MTISQKNTVRRLSVYGLNNSQSEMIVNEVNRLLTNNGPEWTISRLKQLKVAFIKMLAHQDPEWTWISTRSGIPTGPFRAIFNLKKPHKVLNSLMVYTSLISPKLTDKQWKKFSLSVSKVRKEPKSLFDDLGAIFSFESKSIIPSSDMRISRMLSSTIRSPDISSGMKTRTNTVRNSISSANHFLARAYINKHLMSKGILPDWFEQEITRNWKSINSVHNGIDTKGVVGRISFLQEPGFKLRAIANPLPIFQILLDPLKQSLLETLRLIPNDFTHDQDGGVDYVQSLLKSGLTLSSVDLSDATNHLPLSDQIMILKTLFKDNTAIIDLFKDVSEASWVVDSPEGETKLSWRTGQPLGLSPSFPSFALYHHFIMRYVISVYENDLYPIRDLIQEVTIGGECGKFNYAIVGDDIVMDAKYTSVYLDTMALLECPVSLDKCLFRADVAEFCSRIITKEKIIRAYKWRSVTDASFISFCKAFGPNVMTLLRPKQRKIVERIGEIPDTLGGPIGWNPNGKCLMQREAELWHLAEILSDLSDQYDVSVPRAEVHYHLKRELGMIRFAKTSLSNLVNNKTESNVTAAENARLRFVKELLFQLNLGVPAQIAFRSSVSLYDPSSYTRYHMTDLEREFYKFTLPVLSSEENLKDDRFIRKLYALLFKKDG